MPTGDSEAEVKPVESMFMHVPDKGIIGDCHRAVIASLMEMKAEEVPHFFDYPVDQGSEIGLGRAREWLSEYGLTHFELPFTSPSLEEALDFVSHYTEDLYYTLTGSSKADENHIVICKKKKIIHDPSYGIPHGIVGPAKDGHWWFGWLVATKPEFQWSRDVG